MLFPTINRWCRLLTALNKLAITFLHWGCKDTETYDYIPQPVNMNFPNVNLHIESYAVLIIILVALCLAYCVVMAALCLAYCAVMAALRLAYCAVMAALRLAYCAFMAALRLAYCAFMAALPLMHDIALVAVHEAYGT